MPRKANWGDVGKFFQGTFGTASVVGSFYNSDPDGSMVDGALCASLAFASGGGREIAGTELKHLTVSKTWA